MRVLKCVFWNFIDISMRHDCCDYIEIRDQFRKHIHKSIVNSYLKQTCNKALKEQLFKHFCDSHEAYAVL